AGRAAGGARRRCGRRPAIESRAPDGGGSGQSHQVPIDTAIYRENGNLLLDRVLGAVTHLCAAGETRADVIAGLLPRLRAEGEVPYHIPVGGSNEIGALGYAAAALELLQQSKEAGIAIDRVL